MTAARGPSMFHPNRFGRLLLPVALVLLIAPLTAAGAGACEKHLNGHQQGSDTNGEGARR